MQRSYVYPLVVILIGLSLHFVPVKSNDLVPSDMYSICKIESTKPYQIQELLDLGFDVNKLDPHGFSALHHASWNLKDHRALMRLIDAGADVNIRGQSDLTPLHGAANNNKNLKVLESLIVSGANVNAKTFDGSTPLHSAAFVNTNEVVELLIVSGALINETNTKGYTPLHLAAKSNKDIRVINTLVKVGADIFAKTNTGKTALEFAQSNKSFQSVEQFKVLLGNKLEN